MKYADEVISSVMMFMQSFMKVCQLVQTLCRSI